MNNTRIEGLDLMRSIAILLVVIGHNLIFIPIHIRNYLSPFLLDGVSLFFVLSGYLIGKILWEKLPDKSINSKDLFHFWKRRWMRTLPNYFSILIIIIILSKLLDKEINVNLFQYFLFLQNLFTPQSEGFFPESWSLAVEEWFYILLPIFLLIFSYFKVERLKVFYLSFFVFFIISFLFRLYIYDSGMLVDIHMFDILIRKTVIGRLDSIFFGVISYIIIDILKISSLEKHKALLFFSIILIVTNEYIKIFIPSDFYLAVFYFPVESIAICLSLPYFIKVKISNRTLSSIVKITSKLSYSMYLVNFSLIKILVLDSVIINDIFLNRFIKLILFIPLTYIVAYLAYNYIEKPFMKLREKI